MRKKILLILFLLCSLLQENHAQENGVVALELPVRNSLKFNRHIVNPTFSFVREQNKYISFSNKRQWNQFENAPQAFLFGFSGRFAEDIGAGVTLFQRDYGIYTTFGGLTNFSYNVSLNRFSNLTFGLNLGAYQSSINTGRVIANLSDPSLNNASSSFVLTINPGINYGTTFFDFGVSVNNLVTYNISNSNLIEENPEQAFQAHAMYTGYVEGRGFFSQSKFSALIRSEFKKEKTVLSGVMMLSIPKGIWGQIGYNNLFGASAGLGVNVSSQVALEYNYEQSLGQLSGFGSSHELSIAYRFKKNPRYSYSDFDDEASLFKSTRSKRVLASNSKTKKGLTRTPRKSSKVKEEKVEEIVEQAEPVIEIEEEDKELAEAKLKEEQERLEEEARLKAEAEAKEQERILAQQRERERAEAQKKLEEARLKAEEEARLKAEEEARIAEEERIKQEELDAVLVSAPKGENEEMINSLTELTNASKIQQQELLIKLQEKVDVKQQDLDDLKEENDLSEKGVYVEPKPFKSISAENAAINQIKVDIDNLIKEQAIKIQELETVYISRLKKVGDKLDPLTLQYSKVIQELKTERLKTIRAKENLEANLDKIEVATEIERKRRIKRALYDNDQDRYLKDKAVLNRIINNTPVSEEPLSEEDFDFGEEQSSGIQILKNVNNVEDGYYLVVAVHSDENKRDDFLRKMVSSGQQNVNFFYDVNTSKYYIYYEKHDYLNNAQEALKAKGSKPYNGKMALIKIEN